VGLDDIEIHHGYVTESRSGQADNDIQTYTSGSYNENSAPSQVGLALLTPGTHSPLLPFGVLWSWA